MMRAKSLGKFAMIFAVLSIAAGCHPAPDPDEIVVQRFFGTCRAQYGTETNVSAASSECGIMTTLINKFSAENPDVKVRVNPVPWPGYEQLAAQLAADDAPDLVTMHVSAIADYASRNLLEPMDEGLKAAGVDPATFTDVSLRGVTKKGHIYGMPFDTWAPLWHINLNYFRQAGLVGNSGEPQLPRSPEELLEQARQFRRATGKPYFVQSLVNERAMYTRNLYTFLMQQKAGFFDDPQRITLRTPEARRIVELFKTLYEESLTTRDQDYAAATNGFMNGAGGVYLMGTWLIGDFEAESRKPNRPLSNGYTVVPYPQLYPGRDVTFADGHAWVIPVKERRTPQQRRAAYRLLRFLADHNYEWARTGHLPAFRAVIRSEQFNQLPHRNRIARLTSVGMPLPAGVQRQWPIQDIIGDELGAAIAGDKPVDEALADAEHRINDLLFHLL